MHRQGGMRQRETGLGRSYRVIELLVVGILQQLVLALRVADLVVEQHTVVHHQTMAQHALVVRLQLAPIAGEAVRLLVGGAPIASAAYTHHSLVEKVQLAVHGAPVAVEESAPGCLLAVVPGKALLCSLQQLLRRAVALHLHLTQRHTLLTQLHITLLKELCHSALNSHVAHRAHHYRVVLVSRWHLEPVLAVVVAGHTDRCAFELQRSVRHSATAAGHSSGQHRHRLLPGGSGAHGQKQSQNTYLQQQPRHNKNYGAKIIFFPKQCKSNYNTLILNPNII